MAKEAFNRKEFFATVEIIAREMEIPADAIYEKIAAALCTAVANKNSGLSSCIHCEIDPVLKDIRMYMVKEVIDDPVDDDEPDEDELAEAEAESETEQTEEELKKARRIAQRDPTKLTVTEAQSYKPGAIAGDTVVIDIDMAAFGRQIAQKVKHVLRSGLKDAANDRALTVYQSKNQELVTGTVVDVNPVNHALTLRIGSGEVVMPENEQIRGERYGIGDRILVYIAVDDKERDGVRISRVLVSRTHPGLVKRLLEREIPEIADGTVEVKDIQRAAGIKTKVSVDSRDPEVDPVGACIGRDSTRVSAIVRELGGEQLEIVRFSQDPIEYVTEALKPAPVLTVVITDRAARSCRVTVPTDKLSLAIGKGGVNVSLAARLTKWKIDITSPAVNPELAKLDD